MFLIRDIMYCKPGKARPMVEMNAPTRRDGRCHPGLYAIESSADVPPCPDHVIAPDQRGGAFLLAPHG